jgi:hypothetical protein
MRVKVRGVVYESVDECAAALGVCRGTVCAALSRGREDAIGTGRGRHSGDRTGRAKPITVGGVRYPSIAAASRGLGMADGWLGDVLKKMKHRGPGYGAVVLRRLYGADGAVVGRALREATYGGGGDGCDSRARQERRLRAKARAGGVVEGSDHEC